MSALIQNAHPKSWDKTPRVPRQYFEVHDWAGNILTFRGKFELLCFAVALAFSSFDAAEEWLRGAWENEYDENRQDVEIVEKRG